MILIIQLCMIKIFYIILDICFSIPFESCILESMNYINESKAIKKIFVFPVACQIKTG